MHTCTLPSLVEITKLHLVYMYVALAFCLPVCFLNCTQYVHTDTMFSPHPVRRARVDTAQTVMRGRLVPGRGLK